jgi:hypothetical protein
LLNQEQHQPAAIQPEPYVDAQRAAEFLSIEPRQLLRLARAGQIPGYPISLGTGKRNVWRFRLSELATTMQQRLNSSRQIPAPERVQ